MFGAIYVERCAAASVVGKNLVILRKKVPGLNSSILERFVARARRAAALRDTVNVLVTSNSELRRLNQQFRGIDEATDVLSFPSLAPVGGAARRAAGEVAISADFARENAHGLGHPVAEEVKILALHGILHLAGYDHERDQGEMARKESNLRRKLGLETGLIERTQTEQSKVKREAERTDLPENQRATRRPSMGKNPRQHTSPNPRRGRRRTA